MSAVAIVGSGPTGCYLAQALKKSRPDLDVVILEKRAVPYGLVRAGVAPDHTGTKAVTRQFDRLFEREGVRLVTGVDVGRTVSLDALRALFPAVVLAVGLEADRRLAIPGETLPGVTGSGAFARYANGEDGAPAPLLGRHLVVVGAGNVAIDVARVSLKGAGAFSGSTPVERVTIIARGAREAARFDAAMLKELEQVAGARCTFRFDTRPIEIIGRERVTGVRVAGPARPAGPAARGRDRLRRGRDRDRLRARRRPDRDRPAGARRADPPGRRVVRRGLVPARAARHDSGRARGGTVGRGRGPRDACLGTAKPGYDGLKALIGATA